MALRQGNGQMLPLILINNKRNNRLGIEIAQHCFAEATDVKKPQSFLTEASNMADVKRLELGQHRAVLILAESVALPIAHTKKPQSFD